MTSHTDHLPSDRDYQARLAADIAPYIRMPQTAEELAWTSMQAKLDPDDDDVDYEALLGPHD